MNFQCKVNDQTTVDSSTYAGLQRQQRLQEQTEASGDDLAYDVRFIKLSNMLLSRDPSTLQTVAWMKRLF